MSKVWSKEVDRFCHQYLQVEPTLDFPSPEFLRLSEVQDALYALLYADGAVRYGPPARYQTKILKELVAKVEASIDDWDQYEVSENLMSTLSSLLATPVPGEAASVQQKCYVTYHLSALPASAELRHDITLLENRSLISAGGTTGLRTWEAAIHLGQYLSRNPAVVQHKRILELGAGTGYLSILCADHLDAAHVIASDGSDDVINNLPDNFFLNNLQDSTKVIPMEVKWGHALVGTEDEKWNGGNTVDVVLGADVTYDKRVIPALVGTVLELFDLFPTVEVYIAATQRNEETFSVFLDTCKKNALVVEDMEFPVIPRGLQEGPFYSDGLAIRICRLSRS
ncbi:unnamed protein product [Clonostachys rhizophaga]|uniref:Protein-lysine N-methyltransferase EFM3 n=1 Tax=Clonostachys rhizophaga TaxID=160324 RepID=A0A9N9YGE8_9HYPO|nr:unnamed protein product [Clonostachys rhizophaga]